MILDQNISNLWKFKKSLIFDPIFESPDWIAHFSTYNLNTIYIISEQIFLTKIPIFEIRKFFFYSQAEMVGKGNIHAVYAWRIIRVR